MDGVYGGRQVVANWPQADRSGNLGPIPGWYRELLEGLAADLTRWREDEPEQVTRQRCDPRHRSGGRSRRDRRAG